MGLLDYFRPAARERVEPRFFAASPENPNTSLSNPAPWLEDWMAGGSASGFGPAVNERTSMACSAVYRSVSMVSGMIAGMPLKIYRRTADGGRELAPSHKLQPMFQVAPYPGRAMTAFTWRELWIVNEQLWGNHYSVIRYDNAGRVVGFEPVMPWNVEVYRVGNRNKYRCTFTDNDFDGSQRVEWVDQEDIIHIPGIGFDGVKGVSRIRHHARDAIALNRLLSEQVGIIHENSARPSAYVTVPQKVSPDSFARMRAEFERQYAGRANAGKVIFGDHDTTLTPMQMSAEDLGTINMLRFTVADISRFFGVPLHLLNETDKSTSWGSGLAEMNLAWLQTTLNAILRRAESELNMKLFAGSEYFIEFQREALMEMDPVKSAEVAQKEISAGVLLINEYRKVKNRPPVEGGDEPLVNGTNVPLKQALEPKPAPAPTAPVPAPAEE